MHLNRTVVVGLATLCVAWVSAAACGAGFASEGERIAAGHTAVFTEPPRRVPTDMMPDGPLLGNGDVGVVVAGPAEEQRFHIGKNDFWRRRDPSVIAVGTVHVALPELQGASYCQEQDMACAEVRGAFVKGERRAALRSWVDANENLLVTEVRNVGSVELSVAVTQTVGAARYVPARIADTGRPLDIGREQYGDCRWYFDGVIDDVRIYARALSAQDVAGLVAGGEAGAAPVFSWPKNTPPDVRVLGGAPAQGRTGATVRFDGRRTYVEAAAPTVERAISVGAWLWTESAASEANYIVSRGEWNRGYSLGLSNGRVRWAIGETFVQPEEPLALRTWVHVAATFDGQRMCVYVDGVLKGSSGGAPGGVDVSAGACAFTRRADDLPGSRKVAVVTRLLGAEVAADGAGGLRASIAPGASLLVATAVLSDLDAKDPRAAAEARTAELSPGAIDALVIRHRAWWSSFWSRSFVEIPDKEIEQRWYAAQYVMGSCSRAGKVAPGLWGNWITTDSPAWHGDFHLNYNFQAPYYIVYASNHVVLSMPFYRALGEAVPVGREIAKKRGWKGIHLPVSIGPWGLLPEGPDSDWGQRSDAAFAALNFIWCWQYTQDAGFLRDTAYPFLREVAAFWEDYLRLEDGRYVIRDDSIHEGSGPDVNPLLSLGLVRTLFRAMLAMSTELGVDVDRRAHWSDILARLSAYPLQERGGKTVFRYSERGMAWCDGNTLGIHHIFPAGAIGLDSDPALLAVCHATIESMARWHDNNGFASWYTACARVAYDPKTVLAKLRVECEQRSYPSLVLYYGGGGIENVAGFLAVNEMLLQSHEGVLRFFPAWPRELPARFGTLRAVGAFLVSAELREGEVRDVVIVSEKGRDAVVVNPWPGKAVAVARDGKAAETVAGPRFALKTAPGEKIELRAQ